MLTLCNSVIDQLHCFILLSIELSEVSGIETRIVRIRVDERSDTSTTEESLSGDESSVNAPIKTSVIDERQVLRVGSRERLNFLNILDI